MKNILFITHYDGLYGSSKSLLNLLDGLSNYDLQPYVILPKGGALQQELDVRGIPYKILPVVWWVTNQAIYIKSITRFIIDLAYSLLQIYLQLKNWKFDVIYSNSSVYPVGRIIALLNGVPHIWHIRELGELDISSRFLLSKPLSLKLIESSAAIIFNSNSVRDYYIKRERKNRIHVIYNGIASRAQFDEYYLQKFNIAKNTTYTFLMVGNITPKKGQLSAIKAMASLHERGLFSRLVVVGSGSEQYVDDCKQLAEELGISDIVEFTGFLPDPHQAYLNADCLLMCSENEAFGRVTAEAMSHCLPVIGKDSGGTPELITHGTTGLLYDTFEELVDNMCLLVENREKGRQLGMKGWQVAKERFNIEEYAANIFKIMKSVSIQ